MSKKKKRRKKMSGAKKAILALAIVFSILLLVAMGGYGLLQSYYGRSNFVKDSDVKLAEGLNLEDTGLLAEEAAALKQKVSEAIFGIELPNSESVYNILLIGVDRRDDSWYGNSDSMILVSINKDQKQIHMTSFMRDLYADIPGLGVQKLNAANAYGGGPLLVQTIEENYKIHIDNYASVDFSAMIDIVDLVGGITLDISDEEAYSANESIMEMCSLSGEDPNLHYFSGGGTIHMDGYQAVAYARIRNIGNSDYERTERQRIVIGKIVEAVKGLSISELNNMVNEMLPEVTHNVEETTLLSLLTQAPTLLGYEIVQSRVPYDDLFTSSGGMLVPDFEATIQRLQTEIYGESTVG